MKEENNGMVFILLFIVFFAVGLTPAIGPVHEWGHLIASGMQGRIDGWTHHYLPGPIWRSMPRIYFLAGYFSEIIFLTFIFHFLRRHWVLLAVPLGHILATFFYAAIGCDLVEDAPMIGYSYGSMIAIFLLVATPWYGTLWWYFTLLRKHQIETVYSDKTSKLGIVA